MPWDKETAISMNKQICLIVILSVLLGSHVQAQSSDEVTFSDFTLSLGDSIELGPYQAELVEIQSVKDGIAVIRRWCRGRRPHHNRCRYLRRAIRQGED